MDITRRVEIARELLRLVGEKTTTLAEAPIEIDAARYVDTERFERERRVLFLERPQVVGLSGDLPEPGSWASHEVAGVPVLLVRSTDGVFRALLLQAPEESKDAPENRDRESGCRPHRETDSARVEGAKGG
ncbi:MAG: hypothetical protein E6J87_22090 [Deltaproteobacteria bacterium]|nr:MAG: hypothetical protein E6J87_22090 [Deltaproteobacteria bacterium]